MAVGFESFLWSITQQESGGNYGAVGVWVNGDRAYGRYQVMGNNIPSWTQKYYGKRLTPQQYLANREAQDAVVRGKLREYYDRYGPEGAAAMWYSGQSNPNKTYGNPPVYKYVQSVMSRASNNPNATLGGGVGSGSWMPWDRTSGGGGVTPTIDRSQLAEQYGFVEQLFNSVPELKNLFNQAVSGSWDAAKFQAKLKNTTWWKTHSKSERDYIMASFNDPAQWRRDRDAAKFRINELGNQLGLFNVMGNQGLIDFLVTGVTYHGWSDAELRYQMANFLMSPPEGGLAGEGGQFQMEMASMAWANGIKLDQSWYTENYRNIVKGIITKSQVQQNIRNMAKNMFPGFKDQIDAGINMADIASPYLQGMSSILELNPGDLDLFDPTIKNALNYKDPKTGAVGAKPLWQYEVDLRKDPRWLRTNNAREGLMGVAHKVAQDFGVLY